MVILDIELLRRLSNSFGPPGAEDEPRKILKAELEGIADESWVDKLGNIFFRHRGDADAPTVMLAAHMDEVAFMVTHIDEQGFLRLHTWGITDNLLPGQRISFKGRKGMLKAIIGTKPPHIMTQEERKKLVPLDQLFADVGAASREEAEEKGCHIGMTGVFDVEFTELGGGYIRGKAFDDRAGCTVMVEVFKALKGSRCNVVAVGTVQEEVGLRGARTSAWQVDPDFGLALEGTFAADVPGSAPHKVASSLRAGPVVTLVDRTTITHPKILKALMGAAEAESIPFQYKKIPSGGTDAGSIHLTKAGVPSGTVATPNRYIHGPAAVAHTEDLENTVKLVVAFVKHISGK